MNLNVFFSCHSISESLDQRAIALMTELRSLK